MTLKWGIGASIGWFVGFGSLVGTIVALEVGWKWGPWAAVVGGSPFGLLRLMLADLVARRFA